MQQELNFSRLCQEGKLATAMFKSFKNLMNKRPEIMGKCNHKML